uniref:Uncharacterized protein n=1 Tax=Strongyloides papillosus TaxID=174720 RepID=A0A0N5CF99_STREA
MLEISSRDITNFTNNTNKLAFEILDERGNLDYISFESGFPENKSSNSVIDLLALCWNKKNKFCMKNELEDLEFSDMDTELLRKRLYSRKIYRSFRNFGEKWRNLFSAHCSVIPPKTQRWLRSWCTCYRKLCCEECFMNNLKKLNELCLYHVIHKSDMFFSYIMDLQILGGYDTIGNHQIISLILNAFIKPKDRFL